MPFPESVKEEAKRRAHYTCAWCQEKKDFIEVHHIVPQDEGGSDELDNAAPLCPGCHMLLGGNPDLRKQMWQRRDWWWEYCAGLAGAEDDPSARRRREADRRVERGVRVVLNLKGVTVNHVGIRDRDLEVHFTRGDHSGASVVRWGPNELVADPAAIVKQTAKRVMQVLDGARQKANDSAATARPLLHHDPKRNELERLGNTVLTVEAVGKRLGDTRPLNDPRYREWRECRIEECTDHYARFYDIGQATLHSEPLDNVTIAYDEQRHRPKLIVTP